jgi:hypothetical protein
MQLRNIQVDQPLYHAARDLYEEEMLSESYDNAKLKKRYSINKSMSFVS